MSSLLSFTLLLLVAAGLGAVLYMAYLVYLAVAQETKSTLARRDISMGRSGAQVGVHVEDEAYRDASRKYLFQAWSNSSGATLLSKNRWLRKA
ncbi:hypothetical protein KEM52_005285 [Ascosphaera acerosa]|nr:hypothetical protein KEM52_005285 [Ascosphaera acerosa]